MEDLGPPVSHLALKEGTSVYDRGGQRIGVVDGVIVDEKTGIFEGLIVHTLPLPGRHLYAEHRDVADMRERGVLLSVDRAALHEPGPRSGGGRTSSERVEGPIQRHVRRAWDWIIGLR